MLSVKPPEQNKHGFISPDATQHDTGNPELDERLNNAHAVGQIKGTSIMTFPDVLKCSLLKKK